MAPRGYTLGKRAESAAATRQAIIEAARQVYLEAGTAKAPLTAIAQRADVSRGTILHHFGDADGLIDAVIAGLLPSLGLPDERVLDGLVGVEPRMRAYVAAMIEFFRRTTPWWTALQSEMERPVAKAGEAAYWDALARLQAAALGPRLAADASAQQVVGGVLHAGSVGSLLWALEQSGLQADEADRVVEDLVIGFLRLRHGDLEAETERGRGGQEG